MPKLGRGWSKGGPAGQPRPLALASVPANEIVSVFTAVGFAEPAASVLVVASGGKASRCEFWMRVRNRASAKV